MDREKMMEAVGKGEDPSDEEIKRSHEHGKHASKAFKTFVNNSPYFDEAVLVYYDEEGQGVGIANHVNSRAGGVIAHAIKAAMKWLMERTPDTKGNV